MDLANARWTQLTNSSAKDENPVFNSQGDQIAFVSDRNGNKDIFIMNADGTGQRPLPEMLEKICLLIGARMERRSSSPARVQMRTCISG